MVFERPGRKKASALHFLYTNLDKPWRTFILQALSWARLPWWLSGKESACNAGNAGDEGLIPGSGRFWRRAWQPTPVFLPGKSHGQRSLVGYGPWSSKESETIQETDHRTVLSWAQEPRDWTRGKRSCLHYSLCSCNICLKWKKLFICYTFNVNHIGLVQS